MIDKKKLYAFMNDHSMMVISSTNPKGEPQSAAIGFSQTEELTIIFGTSISSRKAKNIMNNSRVSIVIGWDEKGTLQYEGFAKLITKEERPKYSKVLFNKNPASKKFDSDPEQCYFIVKPIWIRYTDVTTNPWTVQESAL